MIDAWQRSSQDHPGGSNADADTVWAAVRDVGHPHPSSPRLLPTPHLTATPGSSPSPTACRPRAIVDLDDEPPPARLLGGRGPLGLDHHHASFAVRAEADGSSFLWISDLLPDERRADGRGPDGPGRRGAPATLARLRRP